MSESFVKLTNDHAIKTFDCGDSEIEIDLKNFLIQNATPIPAEKSILLFD